MSVEKYYVKTQEEYDYLMNYLENETEATWSHNEAPTERNFFEREPDGLVVHHYVDDYSIKYGGISSETQSSGFSFDKLINVAYMMGANIDMTTVNGKKDLRFKSYSKDAVPEDEKKDPYNPRDEYNFNFTLFDVNEQRDVVIRVEELAIKSFFKNNIKSFLN